MTKVPCWLGGAASPYPAALQRGILSALPGEPMRFASPSAPSREMVLPAGGLTVVNVRALGPSDHLITGLPVWGRTFAVVECRDSAGVNVQVIVPSAAARPVTEVLAGTASASGPQRAGSRRSNSVVRRLVGPWTVAVLTAAVVGAGVHVAMWWGSVDITGEVVEVTPKASGEGATCRVGWRDPWSGVDTTSNVNCPATTRVGGSYGASPSPVCWHRPSRGHYQR